MADEEEFEENGREHESENGGEEEKKVESPDIRVLRLSRKYLRQRATKLCNYIELHDFSVLEIRDITSFILQLNEIRSELNANHKEHFQKLVLENYSDSVIDEAVEAHETKYDSRIRDLIVELQYVENKANMVPENKFDRSSFVTASKLRLPEIPLPEFKNSKNEDFEKFIYSFESVIDKHNLPEYEKFVFLRNQLSGPPRILIDSIDIDDQTYDIAKNLLTKAFSSDVVKQYSVIKRLSELKLTNSGDAYSFIGEMRTIISQFSKLKIDSTIVLTYFIWHGMNESFQNQFIQIVNCNKPTLGEIERNIFEATERYIRMTPKSVKPDYRESFAKKESSNFAINASTNKVHKKMCMLCEYDKKDSMHFISNCRNYDTAIKKIEKLRSMKACTKCGYKSHDTSKCHFKFYSKCKNCNDNHMTYLCVKSKTSETSNNLNFSEVHSAHSRDSILLPTFTSKIVGSDGEPFRVFKDGGCQRNYVSESVATKYDLEVVDKIDINVKGFFASKTFNTTVVRVPLTYGNGKIEMEAVVVPYIDIKIKLKNLHRLVHSFLNKGYKLADTFLEHCTDDTIKDIDVIIGADDEHLLKLQYVLFDNSCYLATPQGVMFTGRVDRVLGDIDMVPEMGGVPVVEVSSECHNMISFESAPKAGYNRPVLDHKGDVIEENLDKITSELLDEQYARLVNCDNCHELEDSEINTKLVDFTLKNTKRSETGRLIMPLMWNAKISHRLGQNYNLSRKILLSNGKKLKQSDRLLMYDKVFREQEQMGIIERVPDVDRFIKENPSASFLPHMGVFKPDRETTKTRVVFLSNLCETSINLPSFSHNQAMLPGPCLNNKITTALIFARFDRYLISFDIQRAFLQILLPKEDQVRLMFLWFNNVGANDFSVVAFKSLRLTFGLRPSPCILMLALYKILIIDIEDDCDEIVELKKDIFHLIYMDNGAVGCNSIEKLHWIYEQLPKIFLPYQFQLQQYMCNDFELQSKIDNQTDSVTPDSVKLLGTMWDRNSDSISPVKLQLDKKANTKRKVLSAINSVYDVFGLYTPLLNRSKLFLQKVQADESLGWDTVLSASYLREWHNITNQCNSVPCISVERFVGTKDSNYSLIAFTDASRQLYGVVIYILDLNTNRLSFLIAKSRVISKQLEEKTIPSLEFHAISYGTEILMNMYLELCGGKVISGIKVRDLRLYTDSLVALHWLNSYANKFSKMQKISVFVMNRIKTIDKLCAIKPITFHFTDGKTNPADAISRPFSYNKLKDTCYYNGPLALINEGSHCDTKVTIPNPIARISDEVIDSDITIEECKVLFSASEVMTGHPIYDHVVPVDRYSSLKRLIRVTALVLKFIRRIKQKFTVPCLTKSINDFDCNSYKIACAHILWVEQSKSFPDLFQYFSNKLKGKSPELIEKYNLFQSSDSLIRVKCKLNYDNDFEYPILLPSNNVLTDLIIRNCHWAINHGGIYSVLRELRPKFWIIHYYSNVRRNLRKCITCGRYNNRTVKVNQNVYRDFRFSPPDKPFSSVYLDYIGPYTVLMGNEKRKVYILIITCLFTRAVNLKLCANAETEEFLRAIQLHIYDYGLFQECRADLGSQITAGFNLLRNFFSDMETKTFLEENGIASLGLDQFCKGNSALGSVVESLVKQTKRLINKAITTKILTYLDFNFIVCQTVHLINRRPVGFKDGLRNNSDEIPEALTPEMLIHGYSLISLNTIPNLQPSAPLSDPDWDLVRTGPNKVSVVYDKIRKTREALIDCYHSEFVTTLIHQAMDKKGRYDRVKHAPLEPGDIVLLVDKFLKPTNYPMGRVVKVDTNSQGETTAAYVLKGNKETVYRHSTTIIPLMKNVISQRITENTVDNKLSNVEEVKTKPRIRRKTALKCEATNKKLSDDNLV